jgi:hypothetical protein
VIHSSLGPRCKLQAQIRTRVGWQRRPNSCTWRRWRGDHSTRTRRFSNQPHRRSPAALGNPPHAVPVRRCQLVLLGCQVVIAPTRERTQRCLHAGGAALGGVLVPEASERQQEIDDFLMHASQPGFELWLRLTVLLQTAQLELRVCRPRPSPSPAGQPTAAPGTPVEDLPLRPLGRRSALVPRPFTREPVGRTSPWRRAATRTDRRFMVRSMEKLVSAYATNTIKVRSKATRPIRSNGSVKYITRHPN